MVTRLMYIAGVMVMKLLVPQWWFQGWCLWQWKWSWSWFLDFWYDVIMPTRRSVLHIHMNPYFGSHGAIQYIHGKPITFGYKWVSEQFLNDTSAQCRLLCFRFKNDLTNLCILDAVKQNQVIFLNVFCYDAMPVNASTFEEIFTSTRSEAGSNRRSTESRVMSWRLDYIADTEGRPVWCLLVTVWTSNVWVLLVGILQPQPVLSSMNQHHTSSITIPTSSTQSLRGGNYLPRFV